MACCTTVQVSAHPQRIKEILTIITRCHEVLFAGSNPWNAWYRWMTDPPMILMMILNGQRDTFWLAFLNIRRSILWIGCRSRQRSLVIRQRLVPVEEDTLEQVARAVNPHTSRNASRLTPIHARIPPTNCIPVQPNYGTWFSRNRPTWCQRWQGRSNQVLKPRREVSICPATFQGQKLSNSWEPTCTCHHLPRLQTSETNPILYCCALFVKMFNSPGNLGLWDPVYCIWEQ